MILLGIYAQAMISAIAGEKISVDDIVRVVRVVGQGIWAANSGREGAA